jgi:hypothetical protein
MERDDEGGVVILRLHGWKALAVIALTVVGVVAARMYQYERLEAEATEQLRSHLELRYLAPLVEEARAGMDDGAVAAETLERLANLPEIEIVAIRAKGSGSDVVARVEYLLDGSAPPAGEAPLYFKMHYSYLTGWGVEHETTALRYYMTLF